MRPRSKKAPENEKGAIEHLKEAVASGQHWYLALLEAIGLWTLSEEVYRGQLRRYLIAGEAFDWLLLVERLGELALASYLLQTDDTHLKVLDDSRKPAIKRGALWCYIGDREHVYFEYTPNRKKEGPQAFSRNPWYEML